MIRIAPLFYRLVEVHETDNTLSGMIKMIGETISDYRILEKLGEGAMGEVYKAEDLRLRKRIVAIKILSRRLLQDLNAIARIEREAEAIARLDHPNVALLLEFDRHDDLPFLCMQYIDGGDLQRKIAAGPAPIPEVLQLGTEIAEALKYIHAQGVVHRDIKPSNIMLTSTGQVKVTDFGLARLSLDTRLTEERTVMGTAAYMSPEAIRGLEIDHRSDLFSYGVVLFEMITGKLPFPGKDWTTISYKIVNETAPEISSLRGDVPPELVSLISTLLAKAPEQRFQNAGEVVRRLRDMASSLNTICFTEETGPHVPQEQIASPPSEASRAPGKQAQIDAATPEESTPPAAPERIETAPSRASPPHKSC